MASPFFDLKVNDLQRMKLTYLGHSCFQLMTEGKRIVFDPFIRGNTLAAEAGIDIDAIEADYILVSHGHDDHTADLVYLADKTGATVVANWEICAWLNRQGITQTHPMNIGGKWKFDFGTVKMTCAAHSSSFSDGTYAGTAGGFLITSGSKTLYYAGDTALTQEMKLIGEFNKVDTCILPIGDNFTMDYIDACRAADYLSCQQIVAMHFDTFGFIKVDHATVKQHFTDHGKQLHMPVIGSTLHI